MQGKVQDGLGFPVSACKKQTFETEDADILDMGMDAPNEFNVFSCLGHIRVICNKTYWLAGLLVVCTA